MVLFDISGRHGSGVMRTTRFTNLFFLFSPILLAFIFIIVGASAVSPVLGVVTLAGMGIGVWALYEPKGPLFLAIFLIPFDKLTVIVPPAVAGLAGGSLLSSLTIPKFIMLIVFFAWMARITVHKEEKFLGKLMSNYLLLPVVLFPLLCAASLIKAKEGIGGLAVFYEARLLSLVVLFFLLVHFVDKKEELEKITKYLVFSYFFVGLIGLYEMITRTHFLEIIGYPVVETPFTMTENAFRVIGPSGDPDYFSFSLVFGFSLTLLLLGFENKRKRIAILVPVLALHFFNILGSGSRGAIIALLGTATIFWCLVRMRYKWLLGAAFVGGALGLVFLYNTSVSGLTVDRYTGETGSSSILYRIGWIKMAWGMIKENPFFGVGFTSFFEEYNRYVSLAPGVPKSVYWPHNTILQIWAECGLFALLTYLSLYGLSIGKLFKAMGGSKDNNFCWRAAAIVSLLVGMILFAGTSNMMLNELYWMGFALAVIVFSQFKLKTG